MIGPGAAGRAGAAAAVADARGMVCLPAFQVLWASSAHTARITELQFIYVHTCTRTRAKHRPTPVAPHYYGPLAPHYPSSIRAERRSCTRTSSVLCQLDTRTALLDPAELVRWPRKNVISGRQRRVINATPKRFRGLREAAHVLLNATGPYTVATAAAAVVAAPACVVRSRVVSLPVLRTI